MSSNLANNDGGYESMNSTPYCTPWQHRNNAGPPEFELIAAIIESSAKLPGALCTDHPGMFDGDNPASTTRPSPCAAAAPP